MDVRLPTPGETTYSLTTVIPSRETILWRKMPPLFSMFLLDSNPGAALWSVASAMHIGIQTISWGRQPSNMYQVLEDVKEAGYEGVELMQDPKTLGDPSSLWKELQKNGLTLLGFSGGSLEERISYVREMKRVMLNSGTSVAWGIRLYESPSPSRPYIYLDDWREKLYSPLLTQMDVILALHPHMFKQVQTASEATRWLCAHPELRFLPDTAHLTAAGDDPIEVITANIPRLAAVHLKDWTAEYGRSYQFYARGFVELGTGDVAVQPVLNMLVQRNYAGWVVVEQDRAADPVASAKASREWLMSIVRNAISGRRNA